MKRILNDKFVGKLIKTFIEGFLASLIIAIPNIVNINDISLLKNMLVGAIAMGISAVLNLIQENLNGKSNS